MALSARKERDIEAWLDWLRTELVTQRERVARHETLRPAVQAEGQALHANTRTEQPHRFVRLP